MLSPSEEEEEEVLFGIAARLRTKENIRTRDSTCFQGRDTASSSSTDEELEEDQPYLTHNNSANMGQELYKWDDGGVLK